MHAHLHPVIALLGAAGLGLSPAASATYAQGGTVVGDTLLFERVGDRPFKASDLAFDDTGFGTRPR